MRAQLTPTDLNQTLITDPNQDPKAAAKKVAEEQKKALDRAQRDHHSASLALFSGVIDTPAAARSEPAIDRQTAVRAEMKAAFREEFGAKAADPAAFHAFMAQVYGENYDHDKAEQLRQRALGGDYTWLPEVRFVSDSELTGANGAFDRESGTVLVNERLLSDPKTAAQTYIEEAGHYIDTQVNKVDAAGDEGEMFRRVLSGEKLSSSELEAIRTENDHGTIVVDGRKLDVEFWWNPVAAVKHVAEKAVDAAKGAVGAVVDAGKDVYDAGATVVTGTINTAVDVGKSLGTGVVDFGKNIIRGNIGDAFTALGRGADKALFLGASGLTKTAFGATDHLIDGASRFMGPAGGVFRAAGHRLTDSGRTGIETGIGIVRDAVHIPFEVSSGFISDNWHTLNLLRQGHFGEAAGNFGMSFVNAGGRSIGGVVDIGARLFAGALSIGGTLTGFEKPGRGLTDEQKAKYKAIYGDAVNLDLVQIKQGGAVSVGAARTVGNTIYLPDSDFKPDGTLTDEGKATLSHEMGHIWQGQNGGGDYVHKALWAQGTAAASGGDRDAAYQWGPAMHKGVAFESLNPEQQAQLIGDLTEYTSKDGTIAMGGTIAVGVSLGGVTLTAADVAYLNRALDMVRHGRGAP